MNFDGSQKRSLLDSKNLTLVAVLAAVYAAGSFLPGFPMIGVPGSNIDIVRALEMGYGLVLGPVYGPLAAFIGALIGKLLTGGGVGLFFTPLAPISAFTAAVLGRRNFFGIRGWITGAGVITLLILGWYITGTGRAIPMYTVLHVAGLIIVFGMRGKLAEYIGSIERSRLALGIALISYSSTMAGHMLGNLIFIAMFAPSPMFFMGILPVTLAERLVITAISTVVATPLILVIRDVYPDLIKIDKKYK